MDINIKKCIVNTKNGQLKDVLNILNEKSNLLTTDDALKIIISLCNVSLNEKFVVQFSPNDVYDLLFVCIKAIKGLGDNLMNSFLTSIYYIIKYFLDMDYYKFIRLENDIISILHNNIRDNKLITLCGNIPKIIYNYILSKHTDTKLSDLSILWIFSMKILYEMKKLDDLLREEISVYFKNFVAMQLHSKCQDDIYLFIITLVERDMNEKTGLIYFQSILSLLNVLIQTHFITGEFDKGKDMVLKTTNLFKKIKILDKVSMIMENIVLIVCSEKEFPLNIKTILLPIQKYFHRMYQEKRILLSISNFSKFLHLALSTARKNFKNFSKQFWNNFNVESQIILSKFIAHMSVSLSWINLKCKMCEDCESNCDFTSAISISGIPAYILKYWLSNNDNNNTNKKSISNLDELLNQVIKCLDLCFDWIQKLHSLNCSNWKNMWAEIGTLTYNLSFTLYRLKYIQAGFYMTYFIKKLILFEGVKASVIREDILKTSLVSLTESYIYAKNGTNALLISALNVFLHPEDRESAFLQWVRIKSSEKDDLTLQNFNLISIMMKFKNIIVDFYPNFNLSTEEKKDLLLYELKQYRRIWPSKVSITGALKEIHQFKDVLITAKGIILCTGDGENNILPCEIYDIVFEIVAEFKCIVHDQNNIENNIIMAFLYLVQYYVARAKLQQKNMQDIEDTHIETNENQDISDKNDETDVVALYESLKIKVHSQLMEYLQLALNTFKGQIHEDNLKELKAMNVYITLVKIGNEFLVQSYSLEYIEAWLLCYRLGKILKDNVCVIESIGNICEISNLNAEFIKNVLLEAQNLIVQVNNDEAYREGENAIRKWIVLTNFYISLGLAYLIDGDVENALSTFQICKEHYYSQSDREKCKLLGIKFEFFEWRLQQLPCSYQVENHAALSKPFFLIESISQCYKTDGYNSYVIYMLFEIFCSVLHMYRWLRLPRELNCYGKQILFVAQQLVVPLKCVQILSHLADANLLSMRMDDCRVKINSICDILGHSGDKITATCSNDDNKKSIPCKDDVTSITNTLQEMMLDFPSTRPHYQQLSSGSPVLLRDSFKMPSFLEHDELCECLCCLSVDYQNLVMIRVNLQASMCYSEKNLEAAREYYEGAIYIYKYLLKKEVVYRKKVEKILDAKVMPTLEKTFRETYCIILLGLANMLITSDKFLDVNTNLIEILKKNPFLNYHLYNEAVFQKINYLSLKTCGIKDRNKNEFLSPATDDNDETPTTPENKCSRVTITSSPSFIPESMKRIVKSIKFNIPENDDEDDKVTLKPLSPLQSLTKTSAMLTSKIKVYLPTPAKSTRKKKVAETVTWTCDHNEKSDVIGDPPKSSKKVEAKLKTRTKLLTEKLKNVPAMPKIVVSDEIENGCVKSEENRPRTRVRKNLMSEIASGSENNENNKFANSALSSNKSSNLSSKGAISKRTRSNKIL